MRRLTDMRSVKNFINGEFSEPLGNEKYDVFNPAFGEKIASVGEAKREEVDKAVEIAVEAQRKWERVPIPDRIRYIFRLEALMRENIDIVSEITTNEHGKTFDESRGDMIRAIQNVEAAASSVYNIMGRNNRNVADGIDEEMIRIPIGVFGIVSPFNFPVMIPFWFMPYAVALGNAVVIKPSERTPMSMEKIMEIVKKSGIPPGVVQTVNGGREAVDYLLENKHLKGISFVGSTKAAEEVYRKGTVNRKRVQAGASAKNFVLVMPDADLESNIGNIIGSFYGNAGERCLAGSVLVAFPENHDSVLKIFEREARRLKVGYGMEKGVNMGPLIRKEHLERVKGYIDLGEEEGANIVLDGRKFADEKHINGYFLGPTILDGANRNMRVSQEEIFGPVASVLTVHSFEEAIDTINSSRYGNASSIYTASGFYAREFTERVEAGNIGVNIGVAAPIAFYPFSGMKESFFGDIHPQGGEEIFYFFTERKVIISKWSKPI